MEAATSTMNRFRTQWLALVGAMLLVSLSVSSALAAHPHHPDNRGNAVSTFVHELLFGSDEEQEQESEDEDTEETDEEQEDEDTEDSDEESEESEESDSDFKNHGHCVREVAWSLEVGGLNENHGGAVSEAARVTCRSDDADEEDGAEGAEDEDEAVDDADDADDAEAATKDRGRSADAHARAPGKNKADGARGGHGNGRGGGHGHGRGGR